MNSKILFLFFSLFMMFCTENPFGDSTISENTNRYISGTVSVEDTNNPAAVFVWLYEVNLTTWTDNEGNFELTLPPKSEANSGGGLTGYLTIYYFIANYQLESSRVFVFDGAFQYGEGVLDESGKINTVINLKKMLNISTIVEPSIVNQNYSDSIKITTTLIQRDPLPVTVLTYRNFLAGYWSGIFIRSISNPEKEITRVIEGSNLSEFTVKDVFELERVFFLSDWELEPGIYEFSPYIRISRNLPPGLIKPNGIFSWSYNLDYFDLPLIEEPAVFEITN